MLNIAINLETGVAKLAQTTVIKAGGGVPVTITFSATPGEDPVIELALSPQSSPPSVKAYLDDFAQENETTYTGTLDANDTRLITLLEGKATQTLDCEIVVTTTAGGRQPFPNFSVTTQAPVITGPEASEGGPVYLTQALGDARYVSFAEQELTEEQREQARENIGTGVRRIRVAVPATSAEIPDFGETFDADTLYFAETDEAEFRYRGTASVAKWAKYSASATIF